MIRKIVVLGGGSAGFLAALCLRARLPGLDIKLIRSKEIGVIGVGEGSTPPLTRLLHEFLRVSPKKFFQVANPTWKLGLRFEWGKRPYFNYTFSKGQFGSRASGLPLPKAHYIAERMEFEDPLSALMTMDRAFEPDPLGQPRFHDCVAYHFENENFVRFLEDFAVNLGVAVQEDVFQGAEVDATGVQRLHLRSGGVETADLYVDCSGFPSVLLGQALNEPFQNFESSLFCDRAVVGGWARGGTEDEIIKPYTTCETMTAGWCWRIDHETRINRGYVYSSQFVSDEDAELELRRKCPNIRDTRLVKFHSGRRRNLWVKNVVGIGNAGGFVEPLEATALGVIAGQSRALADTLHETNGQISDRTRSYYNRYHGSIWDGIRSFLAVHYRFNDRLETAFWQHCRSATDLAGAAEVVDLYQEHGPTFWLDDALPRWSPFDGLDYLALLTGMRVPTANNCPVAPEEKKLWELERKRNAERAARGLSVRKALSTIRSPKWKWPT